jgi:16S rRNA G1207 methylase RsmC
MTSKGIGFEHYFAAKPKSKPKYGLIRTHLRGRLFEFVTASGVFSKDRVDLGTRLLIESTILPEEGNVLDIGCGYGAVGIVIAVCSPRLNVFLIDVNIRAVGLARRNAEINNARNVVIRRGNLYEPVEGSVFDCVLSNPPVSAGLATVRAIIDGASVHMRKGALFQMVVKSKVGGERLCKMLDGAFGNVEVLARESGYRVLISKKR